MSKLQIISIVKKELYTSMTSPILYTSFIFFHIGLSIPFIGFDVWVNTGIADLNFFFLNFPLIFSFIIPILTSNIWSDEYKYSTDKILFVFPATDYTIIIGKYISIVIIFTTMIVLSMLIPLSVFSIGPFSLKIFFICYLFTLMFGLSCISISLALSNISEHPAICFFISFFIITSFSMIHIFMNIFNLPVLLEKIIKLLSFREHFERATRGIFDIRDIIFYIVISYFGIELNAFILNHKRYKK